MKVLLSGMRGVWLLAVVGLLAPASAVWGWDLGTPYGQWKTVCGDNGDQQVEISIPYTVGAKAGRLMIALPKASVAGRAEVAVSDVPWSRSASIKWCEGGSAWSCDEAVEGAVVSALDADSWMNGDVAVRLRSGLVVRTGFRAEQDSSNMAACT